MGLKDCVKLGSVNGITLELKIIGLKDAVILVSVDGPLFIIWPHFTWR